MVTMVAEIRNRKAREAYAADPRKQRDRWLRKTYGITLEQYEIMAEVQDYRCAICAAPDSGWVHGWHVDHDHATGAVRGLLCQTCNLHVVPVCEGPLVERGMLYLKTHSERNTSV